MIEFYSSHMLARHVLDLTGPKRQIHEKRNLKQEYVLNVGQMVHLHFRSRIPNLLHPGMLVFYIFLVHFCLEMKDG